MRFKDISDINESVIGQYAQETNGLVLEISKPVKKVLLPGELSNYLKEHSSVADSFFRLSPERQKEYAEYISSAKREYTKFERLKRITPLIVKGTGPNDKYKREQKL
ncbi:YdeI/OmpD-associated family protein [Lutimonas vermicola]|uniref:YdeI/OmpD-associated family protein n=1 Tax=Lutimonas vermicola TaxID=414288 RepID=A0ABU9KXM2_9FLAO